MTEEKLLRWKKVGGGFFRMRDGRIIKPNQVFTAKRRDIPEAFLDVVELLTPDADKELPGGAEGNIEAKSVVYYVRKVPYKEQYNVFDVNNKKVNEEPLPSREEAEALRDSLK